MESFKTVTSKLCSDIADDLKVIVNENDQMNSDIDSITSKINNLQASIEKTCKNYTVDEESCVKAIKNCKVNALNTIHASIVWK